MRMSLHYLKFKDNLIIIVNHQIYRIFKEKKNIYIPIYRKKKKQFLPEKNWISWFLMQNTRKWYPQHVITYKLMFTTLAKIYIKCSVTKMYV